LNSLCFIEFKIILLKYILSDLKSLITKGGFIKGNSIFSNSKSNLKSFLPNFLVPFSNPIFLIKLLFGIIDNPELINLQKFHW